MLTKLLEGLEGWLWVASKNVLRTMQQNWGRCCLSQNQEGGVSGGCHWNYDPFIGKP